MKNNQTKTSNNNNNTNNNNNNSNSKNLNYLNNINKKFTNNSNKVNKATQSTASNNNNAHNNSNNSTNHSNNNAKHNKKKNNKRTLRLGRSNKMGGRKDVRRGLEPLEFEECIVDSPEFRDNLNRHEKELDHTSHQIKRIIKEVKDLMSAAKGESKEEIILYTYLRRHLKGSF